MFVCSVKAQALVHSGFSGGLLMTRSLSLGLAGLLALACGSSHGQEGGQGGANSNFNFTSSGGSGITDDGGTLNVTYDQNGFASLTAQQVELVKNSACKGWAGEGESLPAILDFVVDVSGSMDQTAPTTGNQTKWAITRSALRDALDSLPATTAVGMIFFPNMSTVKNTVGAKSDPSTCLKTSGEIPIALLGAAGSAQRTALTTGINSANAAGGTPTDDAYEYELQNNMSKTQLPGQKFMVLITDGQPTFLKGCFGTGQTSNPVDYTPVVTAIGNAWASEGVKTFVIGSPGSEAQASTGADGRGWLSHAATVGQTPLTPSCSDSGPNYCHFDMSQVPDFAAGFKDALAQISGQIISCSYSMPAPPTGQALDAAKINVILTTGAPEYFLVQRATSSTCTDGWYLDSKNNVVLCPNTCNKAKGDPKASLDLLFGCATFGNPLT